ncbi:DUF3866 family protein [Bacillus sp. FJAT-45350]|uniref:DUF3866 family protein n=1 Tax=Bacillus sp. FJAT-45350 TaxID=2011014 RepID=UPI000BB82F8E|nr:DUF3866 family protein [Bacillus sp. FJAT-45350]
MYKELVVEVKKILFEDDNIQLLETSDGAKKAMLYKAIQKRTDDGKRVIVNHTAVHLALGTGGWDIVKASLDSAPYEREEVGHIIKARYLPSQHSVLSVEAQESPDHQIFKKECKLDGKKILLGELHSMIPIVYSTVKVIDPTKKITVIISDQAAIPLAISEHIRQLKQDKLFDTITIGQAFGGDYEAVNLQTALQFAVEKLNSDLIIISLGPGVVGTGTKYGFSGTVLADWANIVGALGGIPVWIPRISFKDERERHIGISHHTLLPLKDFTYPKSILPLPFLKEEWRVHLEEQSNLVNNKHNIIWKRIDDSFLRKWEQFVKEYPITIKTMGRDYFDDPAFFYGVFVATIFYLEAG